MKTTPIGNSGPQAIVALLITMAATNAHAYIGPGAGLTAIGSFVALVLACIVAVIGFVWYPLKRLMRRIRGRQESTAPQDIA